MFTRSLALLALLSLPVLARADNDHEMEALWKKHFMAFEQLSRHKVPGSTSNEAPLPKQKNIKTASTQNNRLNNNDPKTTTASAPQTDEELSFHAETVWAVLTIHVTDKHGSYRVVGECDSPVSGWLLKTKTKTQVGKGAVNEQRTFAFDINEPFRDDLDLTVYVTKDAFTNPAYIPLHK